MLPLSIGQEPPGSNKCSGRMMYELNVHLNLENSNVVHFCKNLSSKVRSSYISSGSCIQLRM